MARHNKAQYGTTGDLSPDVTTNERDNEIRRLFIEENMTREQLADKFRLSPSTIQKAVAGLKPYRGGPRLKVGPMPPDTTKEERDKELERLYLEEGMLLKDIAELFGMTGPSLSTLLGEMGVKRRGKKGFRKIKDDPRVNDMLAMRLRGRTLAYIGHEFGITRERVRQLLNLVDPDHTQKAVLYRQRLRKRQASAVMDQQLIERIRVKKRCRVCLAYVLRGKNVTCSSMCAELWTSAAVRFAIDDEAYAAHRINRAKTVLKNKDNYGYQTRKSLLRHARRVVSGENTEPNRRYLVKNSLTSYLVEEIVEPLREATVRAEQAAGIRDEHGGLIDE